MKARWWRISVNYDIMTVTQLKDALKKEGLSVTGKKKELIDRLKHGISSKNQEKLAQKFKTVPFYEKYKDTFGILGLYLTIYLFCVHLNYVNIKRNTQRRLADGSYTPERGITEFTSEEIIQMLFTYNNNMALIFPIMALILLFASYNAMDYLSAPERKTSPSTNNQSFFLFYIASFLIPIAGFIIGAIFLVSGDKETKEAGQTCVGIGVASIILGMAIMALIFSSFSGA